MLAAVTADYRVAGFELLEQLTVMTPEAVGRFAATRSDVRGAVLLATCNRFEAYLDVDGDPASALDELLAAAAETAAVDPAELRRAARLRIGGEIPTHLFAVSSGLESLVVGEAEIAGQVSRALEAARASGTTTPELERLFQRASRTSSSVQQRTRVGLAGRSIVRLALELASSRIADWSSVRVLLIGTGTYAGATLAALRDRGVGEVSVYSPSNRADRFARREGVVAVPRDELPAVLGAADLVLSCSVATTPILDAAKLAAARRVARPAGRQLVVDLGLPRNVDRDVARLAGVDLLDLETISLHAPLPELQATDDARAMIDSAVQQYRADQRADAVTPAVVAFRSHVFELVDQELDRLRRRGEATESLERAMRHLASVLVHEPSVRARQLAADGEAATFAAAVETLFGLRTHAAEPAAAADPLAG